MSDTGGVTNSQGDTVIVTINNGNVLDTESMELVGERERGPFVGPVVMRAVAVSRVYQSYWCSIGCCVAIGRRTRLV